MATDLDWTKINNQDLLENLVNSLFGEEVNRTDFIPSLPNTGSDGGFDGYFKGDYKGEHGLFSIQSKYSKKYFKASAKDAYEWLLGKLKAEFKKAKDKKVDHLRIATNVYIGPKYIPDLLAQKPKSLKSLEVWDQANLDHRIKLRPFTRQEYFGISQNPVLIPPKMYFASTEKHLVPVSIDNKSFEEVSMHIDSFINSDKKVLIISGPGGYGKSHLLRKLSSNKFKKSDYSNWLYRDNHRKTIDVIEQEISPYRNKLVFIDDAERKLKVLKPLFSFIKIDESNKYIFTTRSTSLSALITGIRSVGIDSSVMEVKEVGWSDDELKQLLRNISNISHEEKLVAIVRRNRDPYILVQIGKQLARDKSFNSNNFEERIYEEIKESFELVLQNKISRELINKLLINLSLIVPFTTDQQTLELLSTSLGIANTEQIKDLIDDLYQNSVLKLIGNKFRFNPDLKGDIVLGKSVELASAKEIQSTLRYWLALDPSLVFSNLADALNETSAMNIRGLLENYTDELVDKINNSEQYSELESLRQVELISRISSELALRLFEAIISNSRSINTDNYGPAFLSLKSAQLNEEKLQALLIRLIKEGKEGTYSNYKIDTLSRSLVNPFSTSKETTLRHLEILTQKYRSGEIDAPTLKISEFILKELFALSYEHSETWGITMTFSSIALPKNDAVIEIRKHALELLKLISNKDYRIFLEVVGDIGKNSLIGGGPVELPMEEIAQNEEEEMILFIKDHPYEGDLVNMVGFETFLIHWWAQERPGSDELEETLRTFKRPPEYLILRSMLEYEALFDDFDSFKSQPLSQKTKDRIPEKSKEDERRWHWYVWSKLDNEDERNRVLAEAVKSLNSQLSNAEELLVTLQKLNDQTKSAEKLTFRVDFIQHWVRLNSDYFAELFKNYWDKVPEEFKGMIVFELMETSLADQIAEAVISKISNYNASELEAAIIQIHKQKGNEQVLKILIQIIPVTSDSQLSIVSLTANRFSKDLTTEQLTKLVEVIIGRLQYPQDRQLDYLAMLVKHSGDRPVKLSKKSAKKLRRILLYYPSASWYFDELVPYVIDDSKDLVSFIKGRLQRQEELSTLKYSNYRSQSEKMFTRLSNKLKSYFLNRKYKQLINRYSRYAQDYDAIDIKGFPKISEYISTFDRYEELMNEILEWDRNNRFFSWDIKQIAKQVVHKEKWYKHYCNKLISDKRFEDSVRFLRYLSIHSAGAFIVQKAQEILSDKDPLIEEIRSLFFSKTIPDGVISSSIGEAPPAYLKIRKKFENLLAKTNDGKIKPILQDCIKSLDKTIDDHINRDEGVLNPK